MIANTYQNIHIWTQTNKNKHKNAIQIQTEQLCSTKTPNVAAAGWDIVFSGTFQ